MSAADDVLEHQNLSLVLRYTAHLHAKERADFRVFVDRLFKTVEFAARFKMLNQLSEIPKIAHDSSRLSRSM
jgi:hypothetical protein